MTRRSRWVASLGPLCAAVVLAACADAGSPAPGPTARAQSAQAAPFAYRGIMRPPGKPTAGPRPEVRRLLNASYPATGGCGTPLSYYGGPIIAAPVVVQVSWNEPGSSVAASIQSYLQTWWPAIISPQAGYLAWLGEYDTAGKTGVDGLAGSNQTFRGYGTYAGLFAITPSAANQGATIDDSAIGPELVAQIGAGHLLKPTFDAAGHCNTIYMIDFPPSVTDISMTFAGTTGHSCTDFCGYHAGVALTASEYVYYAVLPDVSSACTSCAPDGVQQDVGMVHSHELAEAMTDAEVFLEPLTASSTDFVRPGGWDQIAAGCSEIGDSCAWPVQAGSAVPTVSYGGQSYYVQGLFDNARLDCEVSGPTALCTSNATCTNPLAPFCDTGTGACVACTSSTQCKGGTPICDATSNSCRACQPADCTGAKPVCETTGTAAGQCVQCTSGSGCSGSTPICDATSHTCRGCASNLDCAGGSSKTCDVTTGLCVGCLKSSDCTKGVCDTTSHTCAQCLDDSECSNPAPYCDTSGDVCRPCASDGECQGSASGHACSPSGSCVQCTAGNKTACTGGRVCDLMTATCVSVVADAGVEGGADAGTEPGVDAGEDSMAPVEDATAPVEAGSQPEAGPVVTIDAGPIPEGTEAGAPAEAGTTGSSGGSGGGCAMATPRAAAGFAPIGGVLLGLALLSRRRRRRSSVA